MIPENKEEQNLEYRKLPKGEERISILGMGTSSIGASGEKEAQEVMALALEQGINYFDLASADAVPFPAFGKEIAGCRKDVHFQIHFGADYHIGFSSHTPAVAEKILDTGCIDMMMFSINPSYDYSHGDYGIGKVDERMALYRRCETEGVGISVMKAFSGGRLRFLQSLSAVSGWTERRIDQ